MTKMTTEMLVSAVLAKVNTPSVVAVLELRGNAESGAILVRLDLPDGTCRLEARHGDGTGNYIWQDITGEEPLDGEAAAARIARERDFDPDLWVIAVDTAALGDGGGDGNGAGVNPFADM